MIVVVPAVVCRAPPDDTQCCVGRAQPVAPSSSPGFSSCCRRLGPPVWFPLLLVALCASDRAHQYTALQASSGIPVTHCVRAPVGPKCRLSVPACSHSRTLCEYQPTSLCRHKHLTKVSIPAGKLFGGPDKDCVLPVA